MESEEYRNVCVRKRNALKNIDNKENNHKRLKTVLKSKIPRPKSFLKKLKGRFKPILTPSNFKTPKKPLPVPACDRKFKNNEFTFVDTTQLILKTLRESEKIFSPKRQVLKDQPEIVPKNRRTVVEWLIEVHEKIDLRSETLFLCVNLLDRFLANENVHLQNLQLVGSTCLFMASKYEDRLPMNSVSLAHISDGCFNREEVRDMERKIVKSLDYKLTVPYSLHFARRYLRVSGASLFQRRYCRYLLELALLSNDLTCELPSRIAAAAVYTVLLFRNDSINTEWDQMLGPHSGYERRSLKPLASTLLDLVSHHSNKEKLMYKKFSQERYGKVAKFKIIDLMENSKKCSAASYKASKYSAEKKEIDEIEIAAKQKCETKHLL